MGGLLDWQNLIFLLPFGAGLVMAVGSAVLGRLGHHGGRGGHGGAHGGHAGHAGHVGGHTAGGGHLRAAPAVSGHTANGHAGRAPVPAHGSRAHSPQRPNPGQQATSDASALHSLLTGSLSLPGLLSTFLLGWGFCGFWITQYFHPSVGIAVAGATIAGGVTSIGAGALMARLMPPEETSALSREQLLGQVGKVIFRVSDSTGRVHVYDRFGTLHEEPCRLERGETPIERGEDALLIDWDEARRLFLVERIRLAPEAPVQPA